MSRAVEERQKDLRGILADIKVREQEIEQEKRMLQSSKSDILRELYQLTGQEATTPLFSQRKAAA